MFTESNYAIYFTHVSNAKPKYMCDLEAVKLYVISKGKSCNILNINSGKIIAKFDIENGFRSV